MSSDESSGLEMGDLPSFGDKEGGLRFIVSLVSKWEW
jgi:hypothetical protein